MSSMIIRSLATLGAGALLALGIAAAPGTPVAPAPQAQAASYTSCFIAMNGEYWCYRYACTAREEMSGCYNGWVVRWNVWWA